MDSVKVPIIQVMIYKIKTFFDLIKFEHSVFALPFAYLGLFLAEGGLPGPTLFVWVTVAMVAIRTTAMAVNRLIDSRDDEENPRTHARAQSIRLLTRPVIWAAVFVSVGIFMFAASRLHPICFRLAPVPIVLVWVYPYLKKITWLTHFCLGLILGIAPYGGWLASRGEWSWTAGLLTIAVTCWVAAFDMFYALQDVEFDRAKGLNSFPACFGVSKTILAARLLHGVTLLTLVYLGASLRLGFWYWAGWVIAFGLIAREHQLIARFGLAKINEAFFNMNAWVSVAIFVGTALALF